MSDSKNDMDDLRGRTAPINMASDDFRKVGHDLVDRIADFLDSLPHRPVTTGESPEEIQKLLDGHRSLPAEGTDARTLFERVTPLLFDHSLFNSHPRFFGYITAGPAPIGILGDFLASAVNPNMGGWKLSPVGSEIEIQTVRWIAELIGYPTDGGGVLVSGGNMANLVGMWAARVAKADWDVRTQGLMHAHPQRLRLYASRETHTWVQKGADLLGLGTNSIRWIDTDKHQRMVISSLRKAIEKDRDSGDHPFMVVGTAGSVSTGAIDPLAEIAEVCRKYDLWFHVDGAYGGIAACVDDRLKALSEADSVATDPHKWLYAPLEAGCALVRDASHLTNAFSYRPPYYNFGDEPVNFVDYSPQNSRGFRALKVWLALQQVGRKGYQKMIRDDIRLMRHLYDIVQAAPELEAATHNLSITTFRFIPKDLQANSDNPETADYLNKLNQEIHDRLESGGEAFVSNAVINDVYLLRACVVNFRTTLEDVEALPEIVLRVGHQADKELRPALQRS